MGTILVAQSFCTTVVPPVPVVTVEPPDPVEPVEPPELFEPVEPPDPVEPVEPPELFEPVLPPELFEPVLPPDLVVPVLPPEPGVVDPAGVHALIAAAPATTAAAARMNFIDFELMGVSNQMRRIIESDSSSRWCSAVPCP